MIGSAAIFPLPILVLDYLLGMVMWTLLGRFVLDLFIAAESEMVIARVFRQLTDPVISLFSKITPSFLLPVFVPVYVAWWFYMVRFYVLPFIFFGTFGVLSLPLESELMQFLLRIFA